VTTTARALALVSLVVAACERAPRATKQIDARPRPPDPPAATDVVLAIDLSKTMEETDLPLDRLDAAKQAARRFVAMSRRGRIGLVIYGQEAKLVMAPTEDREAVDDQLHELRIGDVPELGTAMGDGLALAVDQLDDTKGRRAVVLMADGESNVVVRHDPDQAAELAKRLGVVVYTILVGDPTKADVFGGYAADPATLKRIATTTGGMFYEARTVASFDLAVLDIRARLDAPR
jgi:Ca-activated chloride channel homolog